MLPRAARIALAVGLMITPLVSGSPTASASCVTDDPPASPYAFVGTVIDTREDNRIATVITDAGDRVTVMGTQATSWFSESFSSVDRRYALGGRYEFHPTNASDPYLDNICTATRKLAGPRLPPREQPKGFLPDWLPVDEQAGPIGYAAFFVPVLLGGLGLAVALRRIRRPRTARH
jgi:hypothetical protein